MPDEIDFPTIHECAYIDDNKVYCKEPIENIYKPYCSDHLPIMYRVKKSDQEKTEDQQQSIINSARKRSNTKIKNAIKKREGIEL